MSTDLIAVLGARLDQFSSDLDQAGNMAELLDANNVKYKDRNDKVISTNDALKVAEEFDQAGSAT